MKTLARQLLQTWRQLAIGKAALAKRKGLFLLDQNDVNDIKQYLVSTATQLPPGTGPLSCTTARDTNLIFKPIQRLKAQSVAAHVQVLAYVEEHQLMESRDAAYGAILGVLVGNAAGGVLEFFCYNPTTVEVEAALHMPGGGVWRLGPGQVGWFSSVPLGCCSAVASFHPAPCTPQRASRQFDHKTSLVDSLLLPT